MRSLSDRVYLQLKEQINALRLPPGSPLRESDLSRTFRVSRTPVREALRRLHAEGLVVVVNGRGASVGSVSFHDVLEAYEIRELLEPFAAGQAARRGVDPGALRKFIAQLERLGDSPQTPEDLHAREVLDTELHTMIARAAGNDLLARIVVDMRTRMQRVFAHLGGGGRFKEARQEHLQILHAIQNRDSRQAAELMRLHLQNSKKRLLGRRD